MLTYVYMYKWSVFVGKFLMVYFNTDCHITGSCQIPVSFFQNTQ